MGREIRRVPPDWEHPQYTKENVRNRRSIGEYMPLYDNDYESAAEEWVAEFEQWQRGEHEAQTGKFKTTFKYFWEYSSPPDAEYYRTRKWTEAEATHYQVYQTVSEGSPVTPHFATKEELVDYLVAHGDYWDEKLGNGGWDRAAAEKFVNDEWAPSMIVINSAAGVKIQTPGHP